MISPTSQKFIRESSAIDYQRFFPEIYKVPDAELKEWNRHLPYPGKPMYKKFQIARFAYPENPVSLMSVIAASEPYLVPDGYCNEFDLTTIGYIVQRDWLFHTHFIAQFCDAYGWLQCLDKSNNYYQDGSSYLLKHYCQSSIRYVVNGALIAAALALGLKVESPYGSRRNGFDNPRIGVTTASARAANNYGMIVEKYVTYPPFGSYNFNKELGEYKFWRSDERIN